MKLQSLKTDGRRLGLKFQYHQDLSRVIKQAKAQIGVLSFYHPDSKSYVVEHGDAHQLAEFVMTHFNADDDQIARTKNIITHVLDHPTVASAHG